MSKFSTFSGTINFIPLKYNLKLRHIHVKNFRSFNDAKIDLKNLNFLIGANSSGKSNLINVLAFLRDIVKCSLDDAVSMQGGIEYLRNMEIGASNDILIKAIFTKEPVCFVASRYGDNTVSR